MRAAPLLILLVLFAPACSAGWSVPEGRPYDAEETVVIEEPAARSLIAARGGVVAWLEDAAHDGQRNRGTLRVLGSHVAVPEADVPSVGSAHVVWRDHASAVPVQVNAGSRVGALTVATGEVARFGEERRVVTPPRVDGTVVAWASHGVYPDPTREIVRFDLASGEEERIPFPFEGPCALDDVWPAGDVLVLSSYDCSGNGDGGLWTLAANGSLARHATRPLQVVVDARTAVFTEYRQGEGRGTNLYVLDLDTHEVRRATFSEGRESYPALSGTLLAWADTRSESREGPQYTIYFGELDTRNEYALSGTRAFTAGGALDGRDLWYGDAEGRLVRATLPAPDELLVAQVEASLDEEGASIGLTVVADDVARVAWDTDLDGVFETEGALDVPVVDDEPALARVQAAAIDVSGRVSVMNVDVKERWTIAKLARVFRPEPEPEPQPELQPEPERDHAPTASPLDGDPIVVTQEGRDTPLAGVPMLALGALAAAFMRGRARRRG